MIFMHRNSAAIKYSASPANPVAIDGLIEIFDVNALDSLVTRRTAGTDQPHTYLIYGHSEVVLPAAVQQRSEQSLSCRWLMLQLLQLLHPTVHHAWSISYNSTGAPRLFVDGIQSQYQLSFSHSRNHYAAALSTIAGVAVDIECCGSQRNYVALGEYLGWKLEDVSEPGFLARWTLWEACAKISAQSVLSERISAFEQLQHSARPNQLIQADAWHALQLPLQDRAMLCLLLAHPQRSALGFRAADLVGIQASELPLSNHYRRAAGH